MYLEVGQENGRGSGGGPGGTRGVVGDAGIPAPGQVDIQLLGCDAERAAPAPRVDRSAGSAPNGAAEIPGPGSTLNKRRGLTAKRATAYAAASLSSGTGASPSFASAAGAGCFSG
jgi:hypothetical protein